MRIELLDRIAETISRYNMVPHGCRLGVAVSGGVDSVCLLTILNVLCRKWAPSAFSLIVLHLNHQLRGEESDGDEVFVSDLAARLDLPVVIERVILPPGNLEEQGRLARHAFFRRVRDAGLVDRVATGHTRTDQAETVLFRVLRGTGLSGLSGILPTTEEGLVRPLLEVTRMELLEYASAAKLSWREDSTNRDPGFARNRLRHEWLPELAARWNPRLEETLANLAELARAEDAFWEHLIRGWVDENSDQEGACRIIAVAKLTGEPVAVQRRLIRRLALGVKFGDGEVTFHHIERIRRLLHSGQGDGRVQAPGVDVMRSFDWVRFAPYHPGAADDRFWSIPIRPGQVVRVPGSRACIELVTAAARPPGDCLYNECSCTIAATLVEPGLVLRNWRPGDRLGARKIKELFQEHRVPLWKRRDWPVLASGDQVVWARGFGGCSERGEPGAYLVREWVPES